jgi:uncharacterized radical SAM superfamily protein
MKGILLDENGGLMVRNGSLVIGDVAQQNQRIILYANKGEIKESPLVGVGLDNMLLEHDFKAIRKEIINQMENDGQRVKEVQVKETGVKLNAEYR